MGLTRIAISRPVLILMLIIAAIGLGLAGYRSMRAEEYPDIEIPVVFVQTVYPGAGPEEVNNLVSKKIEDAVSGINNLETITSQSLEGVSVVIIQLKVGADVDEALNNVRAKVDALVSELPEDTKKPTVDKFDVSSMPILTLAAKSDRLSNRQLRDLMDDKIKDRFSRIPGVGAAVVNGGDVREIQIQVKKDKLVSYGIGILDVQQAVMASTANIPGGRILSGPKEFSVRVKGEFQSLDEIRNTSLSFPDPTLGVRSVKLGDIATVVDANVERRSYSRLDGSDSVIVAVQKAKQGNAVEISKAVRESQGGRPSLLKQLEDEYGVQFVVVHDGADRVKESLQDMFMTLIIGIALVTAIVYVFLHNLRGTLIVGIAIPVCICAAIATLWSFGFTLNNMTLMALSLAIGVLVDDCIVIIENIYRHLEHGEEPVSAAINGRAELGLAAISITLADVVVFLPIATMGGIVGMIFRPLAIGYMICVMFSLFVSFTITPMLASRWYREGEDLEHPSGGFAQRFERAFGRLVNGYGRALEWALHHRWFVFCAGFTVLFCLFSFIGGGSGPVSEEAVAKTGLLGLAMNAFAHSIPAMIFAGLLGMLGFTIAVLGKRWGGPRVIGALVALTVAFAIVFGLIPGTKPQATMLGMGGAIVALTILAYMANVSMRVARSRVIAYGFLFGLAFPISSVAGFAFHYWKQDDVFKFSFMPSTDAGQLSIGVEMAPGTSLSVTQGTVERLEKIAMKHPDVKYVQSNIGTSSAGLDLGSQGTQYAVISVTLNDKKAPMDYVAKNKSGEKLRTRMDSAIAGDLLEQIGHMPGARVNVTTVSPMSHGKPIQMSFRCDDRAKLMATVGAIRDKLEAGAVPGVVSPELSTKPGKPELRALPDRDQLGQYGLTVGQVGMAVRTLYEGNNDAKFRVQGREYDIRVMMDLEDRNNKDVLSQVPLKYAGGKPVYLSQATKIVNAQAVDKIQRADRTEEVQVNADLLPGMVVGTTQSKIDAWLAQEKLIPEDVIYKPMGQADIQAREGGSLVVALVTAVALMYMVLASLFNKLMYPFIIQLAQPQAMIGALLALILMDQTLSIVGFIGIITLVGLVGKNAILLVDYANTMRERGQNRHDALVTSGRTRLRPILMTTAAVILGMVPVAAAIGRGSEFRQTIGTVIIGGMLLSTLLTLLVVPCSYTILDDLSLSFGNWMSRRKKGGPGGPEEPEEEEVAPVTV